MALIIVCDRCHEELIEKAAILFSPPIKNEYGNDVCEKYHLCVKCYDWLIQVTIDKESEIKVE